MMVSRRYRLLLCALCTIAGCTQQRQQSLLKTADKQTNSGNYRAAVDSLRQAIDSSPDSKDAVRAVYKLGFISETYLDDFEAALKAYLTFMSKSADKVSLYEVQKRIANIYFDKAADPLDAIAAYRQLLERNQDSLEADFFQDRLARALFRANDFEGSRTQYRQLLGKFPKSQYAQQARFEIGNTYYMESKYAVAYEAWKQFIRQYPGSELSVEAEFLMAQCMEQDDKLVEALRIYEKLQDGYHSKDVISVRIKSVQRRLASEKPRR